MATFANSTLPGTNHIVSLETSWGTSKLHPGAIYSRDCDASGYGPGITLCHYLGENISVEFPTRNFSRALACFGKTLTEDEYFTIHEEHTKVSSLAAYGVRPNVQVTIEFGPKGDHDTMHLIISAEAITTSR